MNIQSSIVTGPASTNRELSTAGIWKGGAIGAAAGAVVNVLLFAVAGAAGVDLAAEFAKGGPSTPLTFAPVVIASFVPFVFAALFATGLNRFVASPTRPFIAVAVVFALLSMGGPAGLGGASFGLKVLLGAMHVVSGILIAGGILRFGKR